MASYGKFKDFTSLALMLSAVWNREAIVNSAVAPLYNIQTSNDASETTEGLGDLGLVPKYNGAIEYDEVDPLDRKQFIHDEFARGLKIPRKLIDDEKYGIVTTMLTKHAMSFQRTVGYAMSSVFNNAFSSSYTVADGRALCVSSGRNSGKAVQNNKGTSALTHDNVAATIETMQQMKDANGLILAIQPDTLVVPVGLRKEGLEIVNSQNRSDNANNAINTNSDLNIIIDPLLTDANNWFMVDSRLARMHLWWWWRVQPEFTVHPASDYDLELLTRGYMRYSYGADDHTWIYGHEVT